MVNKDMTISEILSLNENMAAILMREGMHCVTCPSSLGESLADAATVHGMSEDELDDLIERMNDFLSIF
jgi:hybrid cluster-associated redox disulfide protein